MGGGRRPRDLAGRSGGRLGALCDPGRPRGCGGAGSRLPRRHPRQSARRDPCRNDRSQACEGHRDRRAELPGRFRSGGRTRNLVHALGRATRDADHHRGPGHRLRQCPRRRRPPLARRRGKLGADDRHLSRRPSGRDGRRPRLRCRRPRGVGQPGPGRHLEPQRRRLAWELLPRDHRLRLPPARLGVHRAGPRTGRALQLQPRRHRLPTLPGWPPRVVRGKPGQPLRRRSPRRPAGGVRQRGRGPLCVVRPGQLLDPSRRRARRGHPACWSSPRRMRLAGSLSDQRRHSVMAGGARAIR